MVNENENIKTDIISLDVNIWTEICLTATERLLTNVNNIEEKIVKLREIFGYQLADSVIMDLLSKYKTVDNTVNAFFDNNTYTPPIS